MAKNISLISLKCLRCREFYLNDNFSALVLLCHSEASFVYFPCGCKVVCLHPRPYYFKDCVMYPDFLISAGFCIDKYYKRVL